MENSIACNHPRYKGILDEKWASNQSHQESWFIKLIDKNSGDALWLKFTILHKTNGKPVEYEVWAMYFSSENTNDPLVAVKSAYNIDDIHCKAHAGMFHLQFGKSSLIQKTSNSFDTNGKIESKDVAISWDLHAVADHDMILMFPYDLFYNSGFPKRKLTSPFFSSVCTGAFEVIAKSGKISRTFNNAICMQGHNWGTEHSHRYIWCHTNGLQDAQHRAIFEGYSGKIKIGPLVSPWLSGMYLAPDEDFKKQYGICCFDFRDAKYFLNSSVKVDYMNYTWVWELSQSGFLISGKFSARREKVIGLNYYDSNDKLNFCYNSAIGSGQVTISKLINGKKEVIRDYISKGTTMLEFLTDEKNQSVGILV